MLDIVIRDMLVSRLGRVLINCVFFRRWGGGNCCNGLADSSVQCEELRKKERKADNPECILRVHKRKEKE